MYISTPPSPEIENFQMKFHYPARDRTPDLLNQRQTCYHLNQSSELIVEKYICRKVTINHSVSIILTKQHEVWNKVESKHALSVGGRGCSCCSRITFQTVGLLYVTSISCTTDQELIEGSPVEWSSIDSSLSGVCRVHLPPRSWYCVLNCPIFLNHWKSLGNMVWVGCLLHGYMAQ